MDDVLFTFDSKPFQTAMKGMSSGLSSLVKKMGVMALGFLSIRKALSFMPEVGRSFQIAGSIIARNLLNPLRRQLIPLLQSMLNWVRDNRAMFVRWGSYLVNIFKVISNVVTGFIGLMQRMWERLSGNLERIFGGTSKKISEIVNIIIFKIAAVGSFIMIILEPVFAWIVDMFVLWTERAKAFFEGFTQGAGDIMEPIEDIIAMLGDMGNLIMGANENTNLLLSTFKMLGSVVGGAVRIALEAVAQTIDTIVFALKSLINGIKMAKAFISGDKKEMALISKQMDKDAAGFGKRAIKRVESPRETVSRVATVVRDKIGSRSKNNEATTKTQNLNIAPITVNVTEGNSEKAGQDFAKGLQNQLIEEDVREGGRR